MLAKISASTCIAQILPSHPAPYCPNQEVTYTAYCGDNGQFNWTVSPEGQIISGEFTCQITVRWNDTRNPGKVQLSVRQRKDGNNNTLPDRNPPPISNIAIKSVNGYTPPPLQAGLSGTGDFHILPQVNGNYVYDIPWCNNGQKHIFIISPLATFPDGSLVDAYLWTVPAGWQVHNASVDSDGE